MHMSLDKDSKEYYTTATVVYESAACGGDILQARRPFRHRLPCLSCPSSF